MPLRRPSRFRAVRSPESRARVAPSTRATVTGVSPTASPSAASGSKRGLRIERAEHRFRGCEPADDTRLLEQQRGATRLVGVEEPVARRVAGPEVFLERRLDDTRQLGCREGDQVHRSKAGSCPRRWTMCSARRRILGSGGRPGSGRRGSPRGRAPPRRRAARAGAAARGGSRGPPHRERARRAPTWHAGARA